MIAQIEGPVVSVGLDSAVISVGGLGLRVFVTPATLGGLRAGRTARLVTSLVVREDSLTLYGFADESEREVFETLQGASGVGPRLARAVLATLGPDDVRRAVADEDLATLTRVPGVGKKVAQRMVLELAGKLGGPVAPAAGATGVADPRRTQIVAALTGLGWNERAAADAVETVTADPGYATAPPPALLKACLQLLGRVS